MDKFKIVLTAHGVGEVWRNGEKVESVRAVSVRAGVGELNVVTLEMFASEVEVDCVAEIKDHVDD